MLTSAMNTTPNTTTTSIPETTNTTTPTTSSQLTTLIEPTPITTLTTSIDPITITTLTTSTVDTTLFPPLKGSKREINVSEESLPTEIQEQMNKGLKEYSIQNYAESAEIFSQTAEQVAKMFGDSSFECAEPMYYYGLALYYCALTKTDLFGESVNQKTKETSQMKSKDDPIIEDDDCELKEKEEISTTPIGNESTVAQSFDQIFTAPHDRLNQESDSGEDAEDDETGVEDEDDMQLAWETLDYAKQLFEACETKTIKSQMQLADILMTLGDISAEGSLWQLAIEDYLVSLDIKRDVLEHNNRRLAEMYYKIAVAFEYLVLFEDAKTYYEKGVEVLIAKRAELVHLLSEMITNQTSSQDCQSMKVQNEKEIEEIDQLLPEVKSRIEECVTNIELRANPTTIVDFEPKVSETPIKPVVVINNVNNLIKTKKINDITSLVKPKRKVMEDEQSEKKLRHFDGKSQ